MSRVAGGSPRIALCATRTLDLSSCGALIVDYIFSGVLDLPGD